MRFCIFFVPKIDFEKNPNEVEFFWFFSNFLYMIKISNKRTLTFNFIHGIQQKKKKENSVVNICLKTITYNIHLFSKNISEKVPLLIK